MRLIRFDRMLVLKYSCFDESLTKPGTRMIFIPVFVEQLNFISRYCYSKCLSWLLFWRNDLNSYLWHVVYLHIVDTHMHVCREHASLVYVELVDCSIAVAGPSAGAGRLQFLAPPILVFFFSPPDFSFSFSHIQFPPRLSPMSTTAILFDYSSSLDGCNKAN